MSNSRYGGLNSPKIFTPLIDSNSNLEYDSTTTLRTELTAARSDRQKLLEVLETTQHDLAACRMERARTQGDLDALQAEYASIRSERQRLQSENEGLEKD
eukprot:PhF_6_TR26231/c0_g1_i1/m.37429